MDRARSTWYPTRALSAYTQARLSDVKAIIIKRKQKVVICYTNHLLVAGTDSTARSECAGMSVQYICCVSHTGAPPGITKLTRGYLHSELEVKILLHIVSIAHLSGQAC
jgi:hypothetical protein